MTIAEVAICHAAPEENEEVFLMKHIFRRFAAIIATITGSVESGIGLSRTFGDGCLVEQQRSSRRVSKASVTAEVCHSHQMQSRVHQAGFT